MRTGVVCMLMGAVLCCGLLRMMPMLYAWFVAVAVGFAKELMYYKHTQWIREDVLFWWMMGALVALYGHLLL